MISVKDWNESDYLDCNPDVRMAIEKGVISSGWEHYQMFGRTEGRCWGQSRSEKILSEINKKGKGLEIGPSHRPVAPKRKGYNVKILDHMDAEGLREKYRGHNVDLNAIEDVDFVWRGEPISETVKGEKFDWIIASHVIEHTPDLIGFLNECEKILNEDGVLSLVVPDKRYCFDFYREVTSLSCVINAQGRSLHSEGHIADYFLNVVRRGGRIAWEAGCRERFEFVHGLQDAVSNIEAQKRGEYIDVHAWCFVPSSFRLIVEDLFQLQLIKLRERRFFDTVGHEFFVSLTKDGDGPGISRMELQKRKLKEVFASGVPL
ncbi:MAG: methyltransferase domain-containing protein [Methanobacteriota archaeon]|nr:MAG: methyltransferase domain-containing protein [Euryarchaeota archaeon]